jgi:hypothetical protein
MLKEPFANKAYKSPFLPAQFPPLFLFFTRHANELLRNIL